MNLDKNFEIEIDEDRKEIYFDGKKYNYDNLILIDGLVKFTVIEKDLFNFSTKMINNKQSVLKKYDVEYTYTIDKLGDNSIFKAFNNFNVSIESKKINIETVSICEAYKKLYLDNNKKYSLLESEDDLKDYIESDFKNINKWASNKVKNTIDDIGEDTKGYFNKNKLYELIPLIDSYDKFEILKDRLNLHKKLSSETTNDLYNDLYKALNKKKVSKFDIFKDFINILYMEEK